MAKRLHKSNRANPYAAFRFLVVMDGVTLGGFHKVDGLERAERGYVQAGVA